MGTIGATIQGHQRSILWPITVDANCVSVCAHACVFPPSSPAPSVKRTVLLRHAQGLVKVEGSPPKTLRLLSGQLRGTGLLEPWAGPKKNSHQSADNFGEFFAENFG